MKRQLLYRRPTLATPGLTPSNLPDHKKHERLIDISFNIFFGLLMLGLIYFIVALIVI